MAYVEEFQNAIQARDHSKIMQLWDEYCRGDLVDGQEIVEILRLFKQSDFARELGKYVEAILPLSLLINDESKKREALCHIIDLQSTNSEALYHVAKEFLTGNFGSQLGFSDKIRLIGMRSQENFQGALSNFILLNHLQKGNFVLHTAGWGIGEIADVSFLREQVTVEFENLPASKKDISFKNAFKTLQPVANTHFLVRRFVDPEKLEDEAKANPVEVIRSILEDLGPKNASEIKELLVDIVIFEENYSKWWQQARSKLKKDPLIESPDNQKQPFRLRKGQASNEDRISKAFFGKRTFLDVLQAANSLLRDFPEILKSGANKEEILSKITNFLVMPNLSPAELIQGLLFLEQPLGNLSKQEDLKQLVLSLSHIEEVIHKVEILSLKKRLLTTIQAHRADWKEVFRRLFFTIEPNLLKDYLLKELTTVSSEQVKAQLQELIKHPKKHPEALFWYFQKVIENEETYFQDIENKSLFFEALLIVMSSLDFKAESKELLKKMYNYITCKRFELIRSFFKETNTKFVQEFLLLASKCHAFSDHDQKILHSLAEVAHPELAKGKKVDDRAHSFHTIWTTQEGYNKAHERIQRIGTVEIVDNAREIEVARAHGDLRENAEYKAALERRSRLQSELKALSDQFRLARVITKDDIDTQVVGVGVFVEVVNSKGEKSAYTILGQWDADPEKSILSLQSKLVQAMIGKQVGERFSFKDDEFTVLSIKSYLEI